MAGNADVKIASLTRYLFTAPSWRRSIAIILCLGLVIDGASLRAGGLQPFFGTFGFIIPAIVAFIFTKPLVEVYGKQMTWNRSALLAMTSMVLGVIISLSPLQFIVRDILPLLYGISLGFIFGLRLVVLVAVADYRVSRMLAPAALQSAAGVVLGAFLFNLEFAAFALLLQIFFGLLSVIMIWLIERPLKRSFQISGLNFLNTFIAHLTDGSKSMEDFFREIGEEVYVPQVSLFFRRRDRKDVIFTVPNVHPGPMGEIGGGNLPMVLHDAFEEEVLVTHGCATHDFNLVSGSEITKIIDAVIRSREGLRFSAMASRSKRISHGSVHLICQRFGDALLIVSTRAPAMTEDLDYSIGRVIMAEGQRYFSDTAFVDAHNTMAEVASPIMPATRIGTEYIITSRAAIRECHLLPLSEMRVGVSHIQVPFTREEGFGDLGIQAMVTEVDGQLTAYVLMDGNNMVGGLRAFLMEEIAGLADEAEVMTTDTHVVNTLSAQNPIGLNVPAAEITPYVIRAVQEALDDLSPARGASATACCEGVVVFGSQRISQLASTVNTMLIFIAPISFAVLVFAFILSIVAYLMLL